MSEFELVYDEAAQAEPRFLFANFTSGLVIVNSTLLAIAALGLLGLGALAYLLYFLTQQSSGGGGYGYGSSGYSSYSDDEYGYRRFRRGAQSGSEDDWMRVLTLLNVGSQLYNDMARDHSNNARRKNCSSKLICQAFESPDILGASSSYVNKLYQLFNPVQREFASNDLQEENSGCAREYPDCDLSLLNIYQDQYKTTQDFMATRNAK